MMSGENPHLRAEIATDKGITAQRRCGDPECRPAWINKRGRTLPLWTSSRGDFQPFPRSLFPNAEDKEAIFNFTTGKGQNREMKRLGHGHRQLPAGQEDGTPITALPPSASAPTPLQGAPATPPSQRPPKPHTPLSPQPRVYTEPRSPPRPLKGRRLSQRSGAGCARATRGVRTSNSCCPWTSFGRKPPGAAHGTRSSLCLGYRTFLSSGRLPEGPSQHPSSPVRPERVPASVPPSQPFAQRQRGQSGELGGLGMWMITSSLGPIAQRSPKSRRSTAVPTERDRVAASDAATRSSSSLPFPLFRHSLPKTHICFIPYQNRGRESL